MTVGGRGPSGGRGGSRALVYLLLGLFAAYSLFPLLWALVTSLKRPEDAMAYPPRWLPDPPTLQNYVEVLTRTAVPWQVLNTIAASGLAALVVVTASSLAGYGFSRFEFRGKQFLLVSLLGCVMVSGATKVVPLYLMLHRAGLLNSLSGLGLVYAVEFLPISVWLMKSYVDTIPVELDEAAAVDGSTRLRTFARIVFPLSLPAVVAVALITFVRSAQEFIYAATFLTETGVKTSPVGLYMFFTELGVEWAHLTAASLVVVLPIVLVFLLLQRWFVSGLTMGAVR
jgi:ABC-type glycerol-3-phosphate transport system permease component